MSGSRARPVIDTGTSSWTSSCTWGPVSGMWHGNVVRPTWLIDEKTLGSCKTVWRGDSMMALCSKTYYCQDSQGWDKLSSKGLPQDTQTAVSAMASGLALAAACTRTGKSSVPCPTW